MSILAEAVPQEIKLYPPEPGPPFGASGEHELDGEEHFGMEIDGVRLPGHEIEWISRTRTQ